MRSWPKGKGIGVVKANTESIPTGVARIGFERCSGREGHWWHHLKGMPAEGSDKTGDEGIDVLFGDIDVSRIVLAPTATSFGRPAYFPKKQQMRRTINKTIHSSSLSVKRLLLEKTDMEAPMCGKINCCDNPYHNQLPLKILARAISRD